MKISEIIKEIENLSVQERMFVIEKVVTSIRRQESSAQMSRAARELSEDYKSDKELTAFTSLDLENFYEAR